MSQRLDEIARWLRDDVGIAAFDINPASEDASFRRYLRITFDRQTRIVMDAPPGKEDCGSYLNVARKLSECGLNVPDVLAVDRAQGFILLSDLGRELYLHVLSPSNVGKLYNDALDALLIMQSKASTDGLRSYDRALLYEEMELFRRWLVRKHLNLSLRADEHSMLDGAFALLADSALAQPTVFVHRDYHSRNLLRTRHNNPGIVDFQDAVVGPVTYDLISLLRDCYIAWPLDQVESWVFEYHDRAMAAGILSLQDQTQFLRWVDLMGVQRHLKASGIFARLTHRDGKTGFLSDVPRTLTYVLETARRYPELSGLHELIAQRVMPALDARRTQ
ncbi:MAG: phosphotransferase [Gammaproteobacteria bacterium]|nr:phosphotransferase [Gammaproteobacteria bacterium]MCI0591570.1 phosphotransferase [Gammaproteobacteria bacterium]